MTSIQIDIKDGLSSSVAIKGPCRVATTANVTLVGEQTIDGVAVVTGDRVLVKNQSTGADNGIYVADTGNWRRAKDFNRTKDVKTGTLVLVNSGTAGPGIWEVTTADPITIGTTSITFTQAFLTAAQIIALFQPLDADLTAIAALSTTAYGRSLLTMAAAVDVRDSLDAPIYVATRTALKALDTTKDTLAYLKEFGREGLFNYSIGAFPADVQEGIFVRPTGVNANLLTYSPAAIAATVARNNAVGPYTGTTADTMTENTANSTHGESYGAMAYTSGLAYTTSVYAKIGSGTRNLRIDLPSGPFTAGASALFNLVAGAVLQQNNGATATITAVGDGWYRCTVTATAIASSSVIGYFAMYNGTTASYLGDGTSAILLSIPKVEQAAAATDPVAWVRDFDDAADIRWFGVDVAGIADATTAVQAAFDTAAAVGCPLVGPAGNVKLTGPITVPPGVNFEGPSWPTDLNGVLSSFHLYFHLAHLGVGFTIVNATSAAGTSRRLARFGTYRDQVPDTGGWTPIAASADIRVNGVSDVLLEQLFLYNPTVGILVDGNTVLPAGNGRITIRDIRGQPMTTGLSMTHCYDVCYLDNIHWWPFWSNTTNVRAYVSANGVAFTLKRADNFDVGRLFQIGMNTGLLIDQQVSVGLDGTLPPGNVNSLHADILGFDSCPKGIVVTSAAANATFDIDNCYTINSSVVTSNLIDIAASNVRGSIKHLVGSLTNLSLVSLNTGTGTQLIIGFSRSAGIDNDANGTPEFNVATGNILTLLSKPISSAGTVYAFAGTGRIRTPDWINFTPTVTASSGTITTVGALDCKYKLEGTTCLFDYVMTITTNGTGAGVLLATLPFNAKGRVTSVGHGDTTSTGKMTKGQAQTSVARLDITAYDGTYPAADGAIIRITGAYEIA